jgi:cytochrome c oxidase assembly protein subunit 15
MSIWYSRLIIFATLLALIVIVLGAYVRLSDAGLGCPDWPGCYGEMIPTTIDSETANVEYPERPLETDKAWKEMVHRYVAATLGFAIVLIAWFAWRNRATVNQPVKIPLLTLGVVIFQGLLGMWTVTLLLKPVIVMGHLIGGLTTLALLVWLWLESARNPVGGPAVVRSFAWPAAIGLIVLCFQIALGGWTSSNYAALACPDLPTCLGQWWPEQADFQEGFVMWRGLGVNYEFGILEAPARVAIHFAHRLGAITAALVLLAVTIYYLRSHPGNAQVKNACLFVWAALATQVCLGLATVYWGLPLPIATAHNGVAALLLISMMNLNHVAAALPR